MSGSLTALSSISGSFAPFSYWIATLGGSGVDYAQGVSVDSVGNVYIAGRAVPTGSTPDCLLAKFNSTGNLQWQRKLGDASNTVSDAGFGCACNDTDVYMTGLLDNSANNDAGISRYNAAGTLQWSQGLGVNTTTNQYGRGIVIDSSANSYIAGQTSQTAGCLIAKRDSSGTIQWQRTLGTTANVYANGIAIDPSFANVYITGQTNTSDGAILAKYDVSGTYQWQRTIGTSSGFSGFGAVCDAAGSNVFIVGSTSATAASSVIFVAKFDSSGTIQWQRSLTVTGGAIGLAIAIDSSDNIYITGQKVNTTDILIAKYDSSGAIQWQRTLSTSGTDVGYAIAISGSTMYIAGQSNSTTDAFVAKLPTDGSLTGTYGGFTYASLSGTDASSSYTVLTTGYTATTSTYTSGSAGTSGTTTFVPNTVRVL